MRKIIYIFMIIIILNFWMNRVCFAQDPIRKLGRGIANASLGWMEVGRQIFIEGERSQKAAGELIVAPLKGIAKAIGRTVAGVYEVTTFLIPFPRGYEPIIQPEFII